MIGFLFLLFPVLLMLFMLGMERLEEPLTRVAVERDVEHFLDQADAADLDTLVREGADTAVRRFRGRLRRSRAQRSRVRGDSRPDGTASQPRSSHPSPAATESPTVSPQARPNTDQSQLHP